MTTSADRFWLRVTGTLPKEEIGVEVSWVKISTCFVFFFIIDFNVKFLNVIRKFPDAVRLYYYSWLHRSTNSTTVVSNILEEPGLVFKQYS